MINLKKVFAFILMPFDSTYDDIYQIGMKEAAKDVGIKAERLDEQLFGEGMMDRIYRQIEQADIIVADLSDRNPNVFYELGFAHAKDKLCILLTKDSNDIPFDLKHHRHIVYGDSLSYLRNELKKNFEWATNEIANVNKSRVRIVPQKPHGDLSTTEQYADATLTFTFDFFNDTEKPSPEITAIYIYTTSNWDMEQDGKVTPYTDSDIQEYKYRFFFQPPVQRLEGNSWAQLAFKASRTMAIAWEGDEIKNEYRIGGKGIIRLVTKSGSFDHEFTFNVEVIEIPF